MSSELLEKIKKYREKQTKEIKAIKAESKNIIEQYNDGEITEGKKFKELGKLAEKEAKIIQDIKKIDELIDEYNQYGKIIDILNTSIPKISNDNIKSIIDIIKGLNNDSELSDEDKKKEIAKFEEYIKGLEALKAGESDEDELEKYDDKIAKLKKKIEELKGDSTVELSDEDKKKEIAKFEEYIKGIEALKAGESDEDELEKYDAKIAKLKKKIEELKGDSTVELSDEDKKKEIEKFEDQIKGLEALKVGESDKDELEKYDAKIAELKKKIEELKGDSTVELSDEDKKKEIEKFEVQIKGLEALKAGETDEDELEKYDAKIAKLKKKIEELKKVNKTIVKTSEIEKDLKKLNDSTVAITTKQEIVNKYLLLFKQNQEAVCIEIEDILNKTEKKTKTTDKPKKEEKKDIKELGKHLFAKLNKYKKSLKDKITKVKTKKKKKELNEKLQSTKSKKSKIIFSILLALGIIAAMRSCSNNKTKPITDTHNNDLNNTPSEEQKIDKDIPSTIVDEEDFEIGLGEYYQLAIEEYGISNAEAVNLVNRATEINKTGFYEDAYTNDIVAVVKAIDDKTLIYGENAALDQSINATFTDIYNKYLDGTITDADITKLDALKYFAKGDLSDFLNGYVEILKRELKGDTAAQKEMYNYLNVFANSYAGYIAPDSGLTNVNENAVVKDTANWAIAYESFVRPLMSVHINEQNAEDFVCLQTTMLSNHEQWVQITACDDTTLTLGGK